LLSLVEVGTVSWVFGALPYHHLLEFSNNRVFLVEQGETNLLDLLEAQV